MCNIILCLFHIQCCKLFLLSLYNIYCMSARPGWGIPPLLLTLRFFQNIIPDSHLLIPHFSLVTEWIWSLTNSLLRQINRCKSGIIDGTLEVLCYISGPESLTQLSNSWVFTCVETLLRIWLKVTGPFSPASSQAKWKGFKGFEICLPNTVWNTYVLFLWCWQHLPRAIFLSQAYSFFLRHTQLARRNPSSYGHPPQKKISEISIFLWKKIITLIKFMLSVPKNSLSTYQNSVLSPNRWC